MNHKTTPDTPTTERQRAVLRAIAEHYAEHGTTPTVRELCRLTGITTTNGIKSHLRALAKRGLILLAGKPARGVSIPAIAAATRAAAAEYAKGVR